MTFTPATVAPDQLKGDRLWLVFQGGHILLLDDSREGIFPALKNVDWLGMEVLSRQFLGMLDGQGVFAVAVPETATPPEGYHFEDLRRLLSVVDDALFALAGRAFQVLEWEQNHRFCGRCGTATIAHPQGERAKVCPSCAFTSYPRINPCVIVAVTRGEEILLARAKRFNRPMFSTLAGFIEAGESAEEALRREVEEEVGVRVGKIAYFASQPWPFPGNLMLGFHAEYESGEIVLQEDEIAEAAFFHYSELPEIPPKGSIAHTLIQEVVKRYHKF